MEDKIKELRDKITNFKKQQEGIVNELTTARAELNKLYEQRHTAEAAEYKCTPESAAYWRIPKIEGDRRHVLSSHMHDLLPDRRAFAKKDPRKGVISRLAHGLDRLDGKLVADVVVCKHEELLKYRDLGNKSLQLLSYSLSWNGLSFGMAVDREKELDQKVFMSLEELLADIPEPRLTLLLDKFDPYRSWSVQSIMACSRKKLRLWLRHKWDPQFIDAVEKRLALIGRKLRPEWPGL